jgi:hypothetical protein
MENIVIIAEEGGDVQEKFFNTKKTKSQCGILIGSAGQYIISSNVCLVNSCVA